MLSMRDARSTHQSESIGRQWFAARETDRPYIASRLTMGSGSGKSCYRGRARDGCFARGAAARPLSRSRQGRQCLAHHPFRSFAGVSPPPRSGANCGRSVSFAPAFFFPVRFAMLWEIIKFYFAISITVSAPALAAAGIHAEINAEPGFGACLAALTTVQKV